MNLFLKKDLEIRGEFLFRESSLELWLPKRIFDSRSLLIINDQNTFRGSKLLELLKTTTFNLKTTKHILSPFKLDLHSSIFEIVRSTNNLRSQQHAGRRTPGVGQSLESKDEAILCRKSQRRKPPGSGLFQRSELSSPYNSTLFKSVVK